MLMTAKHNFKDNSNLMFYIENKDERVELYKEENKRHELGLVNNRSPLNAILTEGLVRRDEIIMSKFYSEDHRLFLNSNKHYF